MLLIIILTVFLAGCPASNAQAEAPEVAPSSLRSLPLYVEAPPPEAPYLPESACYLGAGLTGESYEIGINDFEALTGAAHQVYAAEMIAGDEFPELFVLRALAAGKIPKITVYPKSYEKPFDSSFVYGLAEDFGRLKIPLFIEFYPGPTGYGTAGEYVAFYNFVRRVFRYKAPNAAFIWSVAPEETAAEAYLPPGADWIGINIYTEDGEISKALELFTYIYQAKAPLIISQLGVAHYSTAGHEYRTGEAGAAIKEIYAMLPQYPAIRGVIYQSRAGVYDPPRGVVARDYSICGAPELISAYAEACGAGYFKQPPANLWKTPAFALVINGAAYIPVSAVKNYSLEQPEAGGVFIWQGEEYLEYPAVIKSTRVIVKASEY